MKLKKIIESSITIKKYCKSHNVCDSCDFHYSHCPFDMRPEFWDLKDIEKALKKVK